jgi:hypothetical protein
MQERAGRMCDLLLALTGRPFFCSIATRTRWLMKSLNFSMRFSPEGSLTFFVHRTRVDIQEILALPEE